MKHLFIEYCANDMLPGDWDWYVATYKIDRATGGRDWRPGGSLKASIYDFPERFRSYSVVPIAYTPGVACAYVEKPMKAPSRVRVGIILAVHESLIRDIGDVAFAENVFLGPIMVRDQILPDWRVALVKESIPTPIGSDDSPKAIARRISKSRIVDSRKYSLIVREDLAWKLSSARFPGCRTHWAESPDRQNA